MTASYKKMLREVAVNLAVSLTLTIGLVIGILAILRLFLHVEIQINGGAIVLGIVGTTLAFLGSTLADDALGRYNAHELPQWKWGSRLQNIGFSLTIVALLIN